MIAAEKGAKDGGFGRRETGFVGLGTSFEAVEARIGQLRIVPVVVLEHADAALPLADALCAGGLPCAEVTFRTAAAQEGIRRMSEAHPEMLIGAGTVLTTAQADCAMEAGAKFIVAPGFDPEVVDYCLEKKIPIFPGCVTPSEVAQAAKRGLRVVKFFPAEQFGGAAAIRALADVYAGMKFLPTGGVNMKNLAEYLKCPAVAACGGSWLVKSDLIQRGEFEKIREMTREAVALRQCF